ncbi:MAG: hypothetical protein V4631_16765 [Pseudomonadota bacterium]
MRGAIMVLDVSALPASVRYVKSVTSRDGSLTSHTVDIDTVRGLLYLQRRSNLAAPAIPALFAPMLDNPAGITGGGFVFHADGDGKEEHDHGAATADQGSVDSYDIKTDPENPRYITTFNQGRSVHDMTAVGDYAYVAEGEALSYSMWDVRNPAQPTLVVRWASSGFAHKSGLAATAPLS